MNDETLIKKCVSGDPRAQRMLFDKFAPKMLGVCLRYAPNIEIAQDVLQDGFIKVFGKLSEFKMDGSFEGWIRRIMVNTSLDEIRRNKKRQNDVDMSAVEYMVEDKSYILESLQAEDLLKMVQKLPIGYRTVFNLYAIEGYSHKEIAEQLDISENTSKSQYSRAKMQLREMIEKIGGR